MTPARAVIVVQGELLLDTFGSAALTVDEDQDGLDDVVVAAQGWDDNRGKIYLVLGPDLVGTR